MKRKVTPKGPLYGLQREKNMPYDMSPRKQYRNSRLMNLIRQSKETLDACLHVFEERPVAANPLIKHVFEQLYIVVLTTQ